MGSCLIIFSSACLACSTFPSSSNFLCIRPTLTISCISLLPLNLVFRSSCSTSAPDKGQKPTSRLLKNPLFRSARRSRRAGFRPLVHSHRELVCRSFARSSTADVTAALPFFTRPSIYSCAPDYRRHQPCTHKVLCARYPGNASFEILPRSSSSQISLPLSSGSAG